MNDLWSLLSATRVEKFKYAEKLYKDREALRLTLLAWVSFWRDVMLASVNASAEPANVDRLEQIEKLSGMLSLSAASRIVEDVETALARLDGNVNPRLLLEVLLLDLPGT